MNWFNWFVEWVVDWFFIPAAFAFVCTGICIMVIVCWDFLKWFFKKGKAK